MKQFQVQKKQFVNGEIKSLESTDLQAGEVLVKVDRFAYTSNNITYAVAGDMVGYWQFFPPSSDRDDSVWGVIPVWGFADVISSANAKIPVGYRFFGYFPPATHTVMRPAKVAPHQFLESSAHRRSLPMGYNLYRRTSGEPNYDRDLDNARMIFYPLHLTAFCIVDALEEADWRGAEQVIILSASSKTSIGLAIGLYDRDDAPEVVGITSAKNLETTSDLGTYDQLHTYDNYGDIDRSKPAVIVDMSGSIKTVNALIDHFGDKMKYVIQVGLTHWDQAGEKINIDKEKTEFFFAPGHMQKRISEWGGAEFNKRTSSYIQRSVSKISQWMSYETIDGLDGLIAIHKDVCMGNIPANKGLVVEME